MCVCVRARACACACMCTLIFEDVIAVSEIFVHLDTHLSNRWVYSPVMPWISCLFIALMSAGAC